MRKLLPLLMLFAVPLFADSNRSQSYFTYDDGGTIVRQGDDGKEVEARVNFPVYPGDEITTSRRGRAEIRLSDGNVIALDRGTTIRFGGIRDSYDGEGNNQTIIELKSGHVMLERDGDDRDPVRLDTDSASFAATERAIYSIDTEREHGLVRVYDGSIEVRTPSRTTRVRAGEEGRLDDQGLYDLVSIQRGGADDFERWFLGRSEIYRRGSSRYLDRSLAYSEPELDRYGSWVYVSDYGSWCWRPVIMSAAWRPYFNGYWHHGRGGGLVWVSYEPWGWVPYHYGRWSYAPTIGWVWLPGGGYSPAWVYWMYGPSYIGWAPAGWYDCYRPYYGWAYRPYARVGLDFGFGFYGRVRVHDIDLRPWTFVSPGNIVSGRVDRAALTTDVIRQRLTREGGGFATVSGAPARFTRSDLRDPATAVGNIVRRGQGGGTGREGSGSAADVTPFFRRDPALSVGVRDHIVRSRNAEVPPSAVTPRGVGSGIPTPGTGGTLEGRVPRDGGGSRHTETPSTGTVPRSVGGGTVGGTVGDVRRTAPPTATTPAPRDSGWRNRDGGGTVRRSGDNNTPATTAPPATTTTPRDNWRGRFERPSSNDPKPTTPTTTTPPQVHDRTIEQHDNWRGRGGNSGGSSSGGSVRESTPPSSGRSDVPRRIIDSIGGSRIHSGGGSSSGNSGSSTRSSGGGNSGGSQQHSSPPPPPPSRSSGGESHRSSGGEGKVKRN
jgi:Family of unknown function (DUF6600)/FecR protein